MQEAGCKSVVDGFSRRGYKCCNDVVSGSADDVDNVAAACGGHNNYYDDDDDVDKAITSNKDHPLELLAKTLLCYAHEFRAFFGSL